jgi:hypothetical protein
VEVDGLPFARGHLVRPPGAPPDQPFATATARRRWPRRVAVALSFILGIALVAGIAWATNLESLTRGSSGFPVHDPSVEATSRYVAGFGVFGLVDTVRVDPDSTFRYDVTLRNDGPFPITIEGIGDDGEGPISRRVVAFAANPYQGGTPRSVTPFSPFRLDPLRRRSSRWRFASARMPASTATRSLPGTKSRSRTRSSASRVVRMSRPVSRSGCRGRRSRPPAAG